MFDKAYFEKKLATSWLGSSFLFFDELESTNDYAKGLNRGMPIHGTVLLTDHQKEGRGQYERNWVSPMAENITVSLIFQPQRSASLTFLTLAMALAVTELLRDHTEKNISIKWPNDVICNGKKIAGLLTEAVYTGNALDRVVIGIGLNVNQLTFDEHLSDSATSLSLESGNRSFTREDLLANLLLRAEWYYRLWVDKDTELIKKINKNLQCVGEQVTLSINGQTQPEVVKFLGTNERGELLVLNNDLKVDTFSYEQIRIHKHAESGQ